MPERLWLLLWVCFVVALTLAPFNASFSVREVPDRLNQALHFVDDADSAKNVAHVAAFFVLGALLASAYGVAIARKGMPWFVILFVGSCIILEATQLFLSGRHPRVVDLLLNVFGFSFGLWGVSQTEVGRRSRERFENFGRRPLFAISTLSCTLALWWSIGLSPLFGGLEMRWDRSFPLVVGNEIGGDRPWLGRMRYLGIYGRPLSSKTVRRLYGSLTGPALPRLRKGAGLLAGYDFRQGPLTEMKPNGVLASWDLTLTVPPDIDWSPIDGITLMKSELLESYGNASSLTEAIVSSGGFSLELWLIPKNSTQKGPARFVTVSSGPALRNFTLGQSARDLIFRVRNRRTGPNGGVNQLEAAGLIDSKWQHLVATYDHGVSTVYRDGKARAAVDLREPIYYSRFATGIGGRVALLALSTIAISLPAFALIRPLSKAWITHVGTLAFSFLMCAGPYAIVCWAGGGPWRLGFFAWSGSTLALIYPFGALYIIRGEPSKLGAAFNL